MNVSDAVTSRRSVRGFLDREVDLELIRELLKRASRAPSGGNIQPWHIHVLAGARLASFKRYIAARAAEVPTGEGTEYDVYPRDLTSPYYERTVEVGAGLYSTMGIAREDRAARARMFARNLEFFGAPVGLFCYVDRRHGPPQWADCGMFLQTLMLLLREEGLDSCPQESWALFPNSVAAFLDASPDQMLFTGMAIGWRDDDHLANAFRSERAAVDVFTRFHIDDPGA